ncbi:MAG: M23 family metallopeptidase [Rickettsiales bacterium]|jgi:murein DD-endopeptidase MepM/ murein hydrolase activator NlpD|nr:M23 family metallopeptidase [Rickettsiales bacterium]
MNKSKIFAICYALFTLCAGAGCDLQPKIASLPDSVGDFISSRYPALLADPEKEAEIYNSAATDYGVYASPELYGTDNVADYVLYSSIDDYTLKPESSVMWEPLVLTSDGSADYLKIPDRESGAPTEIRVEKGDTLYSLAKKYSLSVNELAEMNNLSAPYALAIGQKLKLAKKAAAVESGAAPIPTLIAAKVEIEEIAVGTGDTLYSLSRKYSIPINDLAVMNKLSAPFALKVGQKLKVPKLKAAPDKPQTTSKVVQAPIEPKSSAPLEKPKEKISSDPTKALPTIAARSSSKFSWPVRGKILSAFGAKSNGLYNDGINIIAKQGDKIAAAENGVVAYAGNEVKGMGNLVIIQHSGGWMTVYAHMDKMSVRRGVKITVGQQIGTVGQTGKVDKPQLHFEIRKGTKAYDPSSYLKK